MLRLSLSLLRARNKLRLPRSGFRLELSMELKLERLRGSLLSLLSIDSLLSKLHSRRKKLFSRLRRMLTSLEMPISKKLRTKLLYIHLMERKRRFGTEL